MDNLQELINTLLTCQDNERENIINSLNEKAKGKICIWRNL